MFDDVCGRDEKNDDDDDVFCHREKKRFVVSRKKT